MQRVAERITETNHVPVSASGAKPASRIRATDAQGNEIRFEDYRIIRRNGSVVAFEPQKISIAMTKAFLAVNGGRGRLRRAFGPWSKK